LVLEWAEMHQGELMEMWEKQEFRKLEGLE
jgi:hypothetical protein